MALSILVAPPKVGYNLEMLVNRRLVMSIAKLDRVYWALVFAGAIIAFTPVRFLSLFIVLFLLAKLLPFKTDFLTKLALSYVFFASINACLAGLFWMARAPLTSGTLLLLYSIGFILIAVWQRGKTPDLNVSRHDIGSKALISLAVALAVLAVLIYPIGRHPSASNLGPLIMSGGDNYAHIEMVKGNDFNQGYVLGNNNRFNLGKVYTFYPQAWHFNGALIKWVSEEATPFDRQPGKFLFLYYLYSLLWLGLLVFLMVRLFTCLLDRIDRTGPWLPAGLSVIVIGWAYWLLPLFLDGFQTQIGALAIFLAQLYVLLEATDSKQKRPYLFLLLAALLAASISFMWLFLLPVAALTYLFALVSVIRQQHQWPPIYFYVCLALLSACALIQPAAQITYGPKGGNNAFINQPGLVQNTSMYTVLFIFIIISLHLVVSRTSRKQWLIYVASLFSLLFSVAIFKYQLATVHELRYYYFKSTYTFIVLGLVLSATLATDSLSMLAKPLGKTRTYTACLAVLALSVMLFWQLKPPVLDDLVHSRLQGVSPTQAGAIADLLSKDPVNGLYTVSIASCNRGEDIRATGFAHALAYTKKAEVRGLGANFKLDVQSKEYLYGNILNYINTTHKMPIILSNDQVLGNELLTYLGPKASMIRLVNLDPTMATETPLQCPDRIKTTSESDIQNTLNSR